MAKTRTTTNPCDENPAVPETAPYPATEQEGPGFPQITEQEVPTFLLSADNHVHFHALRTVGVHYQRACDVREALARLLAYRNAPGNAPGGEVPTFLLSADNPVHAHAMALIEKSCPEEAAPAPPPPSEATLAVEATSKAFREYQTKGL